MSPDQPGAAVPSETGGTATFQPGVEPADAAHDRSSRRAVAAAPPAPPELLDDPDPAVPRPPRKPKVRARKVRRIVRHIEPWSVLKISVLFFLSIFLIICVASAVLWNAARSAGRHRRRRELHHLARLRELRGHRRRPGHHDPDHPDHDRRRRRAGRGGRARRRPRSPPRLQDETSTLPDEDGDCAEGQRLVGGFKFEDQQIFRAFALGGVVLVLAGAAASVVLALLFNLISDLTGGVRVTVLEEEPTRAPFGLARPCRAATNFALPREHGAIAQSVRAHP